MLAGGRNAAPTSGTARQNQRASRRDVRHAGFIHDDVNRASGSCTPPGCRVYFFRLSGGVASLHLRLPSGSPPGCAGWRSVADERAQGWRPGLIPIPELFIEARRARRIEFPKGITLGRQLHPKSGLRILWIPGSGVGRRLRRLGMRMFPAMPGHHAAGDAEGQQGHRAAHQYRAQE